MGSPINDPINFGMCNVRQILLTVEKSNHEEELSFCLFASFLSIYFFTALPLHADEKIGLSDEQTIIVDYYETQGKLLRKYLDKPVTLNPLESIRYIIPEKDKAGGSGANFIVEWKADKFANPPVVESIMIGTQNQQGVSFTS